MNDYQYQDIQFYLPDKSKVITSFNRAAINYDQAAILQQKIGQRLLERLQEVKLNPNIILDLGAGTGLGTIGLAKFYPQAFIIAFDIANNMLKQARQRAYGKLINKIIDWNQETIITKLFYNLFKYNYGFVNADAESLPFSHDCFDLIYSNLTLQWCNNLELVFAELKRVLKDHGLLIFTTFSY